MSHPTTDGLVGHFLAEEIDAAFLYRELAAVETDAARRELFRKLAEVEDRHVERWEGVIAEQGGVISTDRKPTGRARLVAWAARKLGPGAVLPMILREEGREVAAYLRLARQSTDPSTSETASALAADSAMHAQELAQMLGRPVEPWHSSEAGGYLRSVIYGFNDGLTANFGLLAGVIGASFSPQTVVISGVAGAVADALSMGASGYLAAKSQAEVHAHDIEMERYEIRLMPDLEEDELALIYEAKGLSPEQARATAHALMADPEKALATKVREELNIAEAPVTPLLDGVVTGVATAIGAIIPILPFLLTSSRWAIWISLTISMMAHFGVGGARSVFTGRGIWASGRDMFLVGFGVAAAGYAIGLGLEHFMAGGMPPRLALTIARHGPALLEPGDALAIGGGSPFHLHPSRADLMKIRTRVIALLAAAALSAPVPAPGADVTKVPAHDQFTETLKIFVLPLVRSTPANASSLYGHLDLARLNCERQPPALIELPNRA